MEFTISLLMSMLSLLWAVITSLKLQIVVIPMILLEAMNVDAVYAEKIIMIAWIIWLIVVIKPVIDFFKK